MCLEEIREKVKHLIEHEDGFERSIVTSHSLFNIYQILTGRDRFDSVLLNTLNQDMDQLPAMNKGEAEAMVRIMELELRTVAA